MRGEGQRHGQVLARLDKHDRMLQEHNRAIYALLDAGEVLRNDVTDLQKNRDGRRPSLRAVAVMVLIGIVVGIAAGFGLANWTTLPDGLAAVVGICFLFMGGSASYLVHDYYPRR
jgi:hypothetical protein